MKIAFISPDFPPTLGGEAEYGYRTVLELLARGHEVTVFSRVGNAGFDTSIDIRPVLVNRHTEDTHAMNQLRGFDVVHSVNATWSWVVEFGLPTFASAYGNDFLSPNSVYGYDLKTRLHLPVGDRIDHWLARKRTPRVMRNALPQCERIFCCSKFTESKLLTAVPACRGLTEVVYPGVSQQFASPLQRKRNSKETTVHLLTVCRLSERRKNVDLVLHALARLKTSFDFSYTVVGDGSLRVELQELANQLGLADRVNFAGRVSNTEMVEHYSSGDLFILPSGISETSFEGFGIVYLEANLSGVPTMAVREGGAQEAVDEGKSGFFIEAPTVEQIEEGLRSFLEGKRQFQSEDCQAFAGQFTWERVIDQFEHAYENELSCRA